MKKLFRNKFVLFLAPLIVIGAGIAVFALVSHNHSKNAGTDPSGNTSKINYGAPTKEEQQAGTAQKEAIVKDTPPTSDTGGTRTVSPFITYAGQSGDIVEVSADVSGITEDGGTCTLTAKNGASTVTKTNPAIMNASTTTCKSFIIDKSEFPKTGTWSAVVSYKSAAATGVSAAKSLEIK